MKNKITYHTPPYIIHPKPYDAAAAERGSWGYYKLLLNAEEVKSTSDESVIAILDSAPDTTHYDLQAQKVSAWCGNDTGDTNPLSYSDKQHGVHVAGIIAASENGKGVIGANPKGYYFMRQVFDSKTLGDISYLERSLAYLLSLNPKHPKTGADIMKCVNLSLAAQVPATHPAVQGVVRLLRQLYEAGWLIVVAAGNTGEDIGFPANLDFVMTIGSINRAGNRSGFSGYQNGKIDFAFPGEHIFSTAPDGGTALMSGTSFAAPLAAACAVRIAAERGITSVQELMPILEGSTIDLMAEGEDEETGLGYFDMKAAMPKEQPEEKGKEVIFRIKGIPNHMIPYLKNATVEIEVV